MLAQVELQPQLQEFIVHPDYQVIDQSPFLSAVRMAARQEAYDIIEQQRMHLRGGAYEAVTLDIDALGTAQAVVKTQTAYGENSVEANEQFRGLQLDCARLLGEAARAKTYEYFEPIIQTLDPTSGDYFSNGYSLTAITEAGLSPLAEAEEVERRVNESVEEKTYRALGNLALVGHMLQPEATNRAVRRIRTITECPDWAHDALLLGRNTGGYVPEINKFMVRDVVIYSNGDRTQEQLALPGKLVDGEVLRTTLVSEGVTVGGASKLELQALQLDVTDTLLEFAAKLDGTASRKHGVPIFMGELAVDSVESCRYEEIPAAAAMRRDALASQASELADTLINLEKMGTDHHAANRLVERLVQQVLLAAAEQNPAQARHSFNEQVAENFQTAKLWRQQGLHAEADALIAGTKANAPAPSYCGAGSCGLEKGDVLGDKAKTMREMGLETSGSLKDTERACPKCHKKEIVYDLKNKVKACTNCKAKSSFGRK